MFVSLNGVEQWITIRGDDVQNPVVLMLHGGPGCPTSELAPVFAGFEKDSTLVQWDQPGGGSTYAKNMGKDIGPLTVARYCRDGIALTEFLEQHLQTNKVIGAIAEADTLLFTVSNQRGVAYNAHVMDAILNTVAPALGWR